MIKKEVYLGLVALIYGLLILLHSFFPIPLLFNENFISLIILLIGLIFLYNTLTIRRSHKTLTLVVSLLMVLLGLFPLLINLRLLTSLPFLPMLRIPIYSFSVILIAFGLYKMYEFFAIK